jgi:protein involved in polysaccharide export with SLBB domain
MAVCASIAVLVGGCSSLAPECASKTTIADYRTGPGDVVRITVPHHPELSGAFTLDSQGYVNTPLSRMLWGGRTARELESAIAASLTSAGDLADPKVRVEILKYRPLYVLGQPVEYAPGMGLYVFGGPVEYAPGMTVGDAIDSGARTYRAPSRELSGFLLERGSCAFEAAPDVPVLPDDIITMRERFF